MAGSGAGITTFTENGILDGVDGQYLVLFGISDTHQIRINNGQISYYRMIIQALLFVVKADMNLFLMQQLAVGDIPEPTC